MGLGKANKDSGARKARGERGAWRKRCGGEARAIAIAVEGEPNSILAELPAIEIYILF